MVLDGFRWFWKGLGGVGMGWDGWGWVGRGGEGWGGLCVTLQPPKDRVFACFLYIFTGFAIDRSKKYIKIIEIYMKIDADDPQAAADNPPPTPR